MNDLTIYSQEELKRIQKIETDALRCIIDICDQLGIEYFLIGGSTLGAIRHDGFIPWDDDIDVGMTREHYQRFLKEAPRLLPSDYHLQTPYGKQQNPYFYSKVRIDGTKFVEYCNRSLDIHHGVYVDIFPFDEVPDDETENERHFLSVQRWIKLFVLRQSPDVSTAPVNAKGKMKSAVRKIGHWAVRVIPYSFFVKRLDDKITQYNGTGQSALACLNFPVRKTEYVKREDLYPLKEHTFGELKAKIPGNYDQYLKTHYGDYMKLPPEEKRFGHKPYFVDLGHSDDDD